MHAGPPCSYPRLPHMFPRNSAAFAFTVHFCARPGAPLRFHAGAMETAFVSGNPVQPVALYYSETCGAGPATSAVLATSELLRHAAQCVVYFAPPVFPADFSSASAFASRCEDEVRRAYARIERTYALT